MAKRTLATVKGSGIMDVADFAAALERDVPWLSPSDRDSWAQWAVQQSLDYESLLATVSGKAEAQRQRNEPHGPGPNRPVEKAPLKGAAPFATPIEPGSTDREPPPDRMRWRREPGLRLRRVPEWDARQDDLGRAGGMMVGPGATPAGTPAAADDPLTGELGVLDRPDGGQSSEISITVTDPRLNDGRPTNIPLLVEGQTDIDKLLAGAPPTPTQQEFAMQRALVRSQRAPLPSYDTIEQAVEAAKARSQAGGSRQKFQPPPPGPGSRAPETPGPRTLAGVAGPGAPPTGGSMPLADFLARLASPQGQRDQPAPPSPIQESIREGSNALLQGLKGQPAGAPAGAQPYLPRTLTDAQPIHRHIEMAPEEEPEHFYDSMAVPRPGEPVTQREMQVLDEILRSEGIRRTLAVRPEAS